MPQFCWKNPAAAYVFDAKDEGEAYEIAIKKRMESGQTREEAESWYANGDEIFEVTPL